MRPDNALTPLIAGMHSDDYFLAVGTTMAPGLEI
jgi:hypothetical protein